MPCSPSLHTNVAAALARAARVGASQRRTCAATDCRRQFFRPSADSPAASTYSPSTPLRRRASASPSARLGHSRAGPLPWAAACGTPWRSSTTRQADAVASPQNALDARTTETRGCGNVRRTMSPAKPVRNAMGRRRDGRGKGRAQALACPKNEARASGQRSWRACACYVVDEWTGKGLGLRPVSGDAVQNRTEVRSVPQRLQTVARRRWRRSRMGVDRTCPTLLREITNVNSG
ncbi:hypothetical protein ERJ75_001474800 [Trypanosoma vivax]|nr:hypothetical protein ERJ75_001474800 [Trypanosoma vivax]